MDSLPFAFHSSSFALKFLLPSAAIGGSEANMRSPAWNEFEPRISRMKRIRAAAFAAIRVPFLPIRVERSHRSARLLSGKATQDSGVGDPDVPVLRTAGLGEDPLGGWYFCLDPDGRGWEDSSCPQEFVYESDSPTNFCG